MAYFGENAEKKKVYSKNELEALRFEGMEEQKKKKWVEVYYGFEPIVQKEYDGLLTHSDRSKKKQQLKEQKSLKKPSLDFEKKKVYSRNELEALRLEGMEEQKKWVEVYCGFEPVVQKEYDGLLTHNDRSKKQQQLKEQKSLKKPSLDFENAEKKKVYSRNELEALRFEGMEEQKKKWVEVYCGFEPVVQKEYDGLLTRNDCSKKQQQLKEQKSLKKPSLDFGMDTVDPASNFHPSNDEDACSVDLGDYMETDDSDGDYSIQKVAFVVKGEPDFDSGPPEDGLEYLRRVRWEAARIPKVKIAKVDRSKLKKEQTVYMPQIPDIVKCPEHLMPLKEWEDSFLADFSELRLVLSQLEMSQANNDGKKGKPSSASCEEETVCQPQEISIPENCDISEVDGSCQSSNISMHETASDLVTEIVPAVENRGSSSKKCPSSSSVPSGTFGNHPALSTILGMDAVARVHMLRKHINLFETGSPFSKDQCSWIYALCAAVDTPLGADTSAALRSLLRKCASFRAEKSELNEEVVMLNMLATISGRYFGQSEN